MKNCTQKLALMILVLSVTLLNACTLQNLPGAYTPGQGTPVEQSAASQPAESTNASKEVNAERMFGHLEILTAIQPYSGWRNSATLGELEAQDYVASILKEMTFLNQSGLTIERQEFHVFLSTEQWQSSLEINLGGKTYSIPAQGMRGNRDSIKSALRFDSDGKLNDSDSNPLRANGNILVVEDEAALKKLTPQEAAGKILFVNFELVDSGVNTRDYAGTNASRLLNLNPNGIVLITENNFQPGGSHGTFSYDGSSFQNYSGSVKVPVLVVRLEDIQAQGIEGWKTLPQASAKMSLDADVFSPGTSHNLAAFIPGQDHEKAIIISAHIDSANGPGAMDDGSGSVILLEIAEILNARQQLPSHDLYLVWYGSEEIGLYGSSHFVNTHTDLLARTIAMLQIDCLVRPLDTLEAGLMLNFSQDPGSKAWADYLREAASQLGYETSSIKMPLASDNGTYTGYDIPNLNMIIEGEELNSRGGVWYNGHIHDPYDRVEIAREMQTELEQMARIALSVALLPPDVPTFRANSAPNKRVLLIAAHNEADHMTPAAFADLGMVLSENGYEISMIPYGQ
ncbi:MAG: Zn-dependent exopeptidase M28, partial [Anaerolineaceae bacterium]|nr:Zn-dependent exopeptidase M28 [Anaerolineaceae bacterium]